jgi:hypothetical protein
MDQQLIWNFEFYYPKPRGLTNAAENCDPVKWEARFFWPENQIINLCAIDESLIDLTNYQHKQKEDHYYLLPDHNYNIKRRRDELLYKPLLNQSAHASGFGAKISLETLNEDTISNKDYLLSLKKIARQIPKKGIEVIVKKESFSYKFSSHPTIKLELARLEVCNKIYFSACIEGKSLYLVETISHLLLGEQVSCDYVTFLKNIIKS